MNKCVLIVVCVRRRQEESRDELGSSQGPFHSEKVLQRSREDLNISLRLPVSTAGSSLLPST